MYEATVRDAARGERLARALAEYYYRRALGVVCCDPRSPEARAHYDAGLRRKLALARHTLNKLLANRDARGDGADGRAGASNVIPWNRRRESKREGRSTHGSAAPAGGVPQALVSSTSSTATGLPL